MQSCIGLGIQIASEAVSFLYLLLQIEFKLEKLESELCIDSNNCLFHRHKLDRNKALFFYFYFTELYFVLFFSYRWKLSSDRL